MHDVLTDVARFYPPWLAAATIAAADQAQPSHSLTLPFDGFDVPALQLALALAGVLMARPLAPHRVPPLSWAKSALVTVIMLVIAASWVIESRPGLLFTFVVSIGLGFSGYALIELIGTEVQNFIKNIIEGAGSALATLRGKKP